jgi:hypothetical protein
MKIAVLYICTGRYPIFWKDFYQSCEQHFIREAEKHYFVFTDAANIAYEEANARIHRIFQNNLGWPGNTLQRYGMFLGIRARLAAFDYLIFFNANLRFVSTIAASDFLPRGNQRLIAAVHPAFFNKTPNTMPFERNPHSLAFVDNGEGRRYFQGAINGGDRDAFLSAISIMDANINSDLSKGIVAAVHDESHWNRYLAVRDDVKELSPSYIFPEGWRLPFEPVIVSRDKDKYGGHDRLRGIRRNLSVRIYQFFITMMKRAAF